MSRPVAFSRIGPLLICLATLLSSLWAAGPVAAQGPETFYLPIRYRSQFDGTAYQAGNCGPSSLAMIISAYRDEYVRTTDIREQVNLLQGTAGIYDSGTAFESLAAIGRRYGLVPLNLYAPGGGYHQWSLDEVRSHLRAGHPVVPQVHLRKLPGQAHSSPNVDHFFVLIGVSGDNFIYHDPAMNGSAGQSRIITPEQLRDAWRSGDFGYAAVAFAAGEALPPLLATPTPIPPTPAPTEPPAPEPTSTPVPVIEPTATPTPTPDPAIPSFINRLFGHTDRPAAPPPPPPATATPIPTPTPDTSAWQIGGRAERGGAISTRGLARVEEPAAPLVASTTPAALPGLPPAAGLVLLAPFAHLLRTRWRSGAPPPAGRAASRRNLGGASRTPAPPATSHPPLVPPATARATLSPPDASRPAPIAPAGRLPAALPATSRASQPPAAGPRLPLSRSRR